MTKAVTVPPLTRNGYTRTARVEHQIASLTDRSGAALAAAFADDEDAGGGGHATEALIYFLRREIARGDRRTAETLFRHLVERCRPRFRTGMRGIDEDGRADIQGEVLADLTRLILADDDSGDFLQSRFWLYLRRRTVSARADWLRARARTPLAADLQRDDEDGEPEAMRTEAAADLSPEDHAILSDALSRLPAELRELVVLRHYEGWRVGDEAPGERSDGEPTLAERYGITPRAIRKRLAKVAALLDHDGRDGR